MKFLIAALLATQVFAGTAVTIKGKLLSYDSTHFKIQEGKEVWKLPLGTFPEEKRDKISKLVGKEVEVNMAFDDVPKKKK